MTAHDLRVDGVVVRTPLLPVTTLVDWAAAADPRAYLAAQLARPEVEEAIFVASPGLSGAIAKWRAAPTSPAGQRAELALVKYLARMAARATPFGLFSGVSAGTLGRDTRIELAPRAAYVRRTRVDNDYLFVLVDELARIPELRERLAFRPNTSIYRIAGRVRYAAARLEGKDGKDRRYQLVSVEPTPYLLATLERATRGARIAALAEPLVDDEVGIGEARAYIQELVDAQLLVPDLGVHVTGPEPIDGLLAQLEAAGAVETHGVLADVRARLAAIDAGGLGNAVETYRAVAARLESLPAKVDLSRLFQVDMVKPATVTLGNRVAAQLAETITALSQISRGGEGASLDQFRTAFRERYEAREVPLAEALDEEAGIGFEVSRHPGSEGAPLLANLGFPGAVPDARVPWRAAERHLQRRLAETLALGRDELVLGDADLAAMKLPTPARLPDAFAAMVRIEVVGGEVEMLLEGTNGPSGARLLGRFCHASPEILEIVRAHHAVEEAHRPGAVFAEIVHLNEGRIGNILCRPVLRAHELVFLGVSGAPAEQRIQLDDLLVSIDGDRIVLRSRRLGCEVIPRLSTAHNFRLRSLGVYRFLCALAMQGRELASWSWGALEGAPFLPRVRLGRVILDRAIWNLDARELAPITTAVRERGNVAEAVAALRAARKLPRMVAIAAGDNELPIDLDNPMLVAAFADDVAGAMGVRLVELYPAPDRLIARGPEGGFSNEMVVTFTRALPKAAPPVAAPARASSEPRSFMPGSEWLYAKLYTGEATADRVLREAIAPVVRLHGGPWFFIRYHDPHPHLRLRLHGDPAHLLGTVLPALHRAVAPLHEGGVVRELVLGTYDREVERYGGDRGISLVEQIFWKDSEAVLGIVELLDGDAGADARWRLALRGIESLLDAVGLPAEARAQVLTTGRDQIGREMNVDAAFWTRVGTRFTKERASLELAFVRDPVRDAEHDLEPGFTLLATRDAAIRELAVELRRGDEAGELVPRIADFAWSLVHMHANRLLHASQRAQEMVLYDFLRRLHAWQAKAKNR